MIAHSVAPVYNPEPFQPMEYPPYPEPTVRQYLVIARGGDGFPEVPSEA